MSASETAEAILIVIKKLLKWAGVVLLGIAALSVIVWAVTWGYGEWEGRPQLVTQLMGIRIGDRESDVVFKLGEFRQLPRTDKDIREGETVYASEEHRISFAEKGGTIFIVQYSCKTDYDYGELNGIRCGNTGEDILRRFGKTVRVLCAKDEERKGERMYDVFELGTRYGLSKNKVEQFLVASPESLRVSANWVPCK